MISSTTQKISYRAEEPPTLCRRFPPRVFQKAKNKEAACLGMRAFGMLPPKKRQGRKEKMQRAAAQEEKRDGALFKSFYIFPGGSQGIPKILE